MLSNYSLLISLSNISKQDTNNATHMGYLFEDCLSLLSLPDISKWNTSKVYWMNGLFMNCISINSFSYITQWMIKAFSKCYIFDNFINFNNKNNFGN